MSKQTKSQKRKTTSHGFNVIFILCITFIILFPSIHNGFVGWDDIDYTIRNEMIKSLSLGNVWRIFTTFFLGNYHPFVLLSFGVDQLLFQEQPDGYHFHNLILHLINTYLVYVICSQIFTSREKTAAIVALLFAIHPLHVESFAWIAGRKDLLYTLYFLLALITYLFYVKSSNKINYYLTLLLFLFSLFSKGQAVTFPLVMLLLDYLTGRKFTWKVLLEKVPFFMLSLFFGILAIHAQNTTEAIYLARISAASSPFYAFYGLCLYLLKLFIPVYQTCLYAYPMNLAGNPPLYIYAAPFVLLLIGFIVWRTWETNKVVCFGILFFIVTILPVLQFLPVGQAVIAERYTYIPFIGLFIAMSDRFLYTTRSDSPRQTKVLILILGSIWIAFLGISTVKRLSVWKDSGTLWSDVIEKNPDIPLAYQNRSAYYGHKKEYDKAISDCNRGLILDSNNSKLYLNRGVAYRELGRQELAIADFSHSLVKNPLQCALYMERGIYYTDKAQQYELGIVDFRKYLSMRPNDLEAISNLGIGYYKNQQYDSSLYYCKEAIQISEKVSGPYYIIALIYGERGNYNEAYFYGKTAMEHGYKVNKDLLDRWKKLAGYNN